jgi:hypothetical protein
MEASVPVILDQANKIKGILMYYKLNLSCDTEFITFKIVDKLLLTAAQ